MSTIGIDSTNLLRQGKTTFTAPIGVAVECKDYQSFKTKYSQLIASLISKHSVSTIRKCVTSHYILLNAGEQVGTQFINSFAENIIPELTMVYACYSVIPSNKIPKVYCYKGSQTITPMQCLHKLSSSYAHCIAWVLAGDNNIKVNKESTFLLDYFEGDETKAWCTLKNNPRLFVLPSGDECNAIISTADLLAKYIDLYLANNKKGLSYEGMQDALKGFSVQNSCRFLDDLPYLTPHLRKPMHDSYNLKHPIFYIMTSGILEKKEKEALMATPLYDKIANLAFEKDGCIKFFKQDTPEVEIKRIAAGDYIITFGDKAYEKAKYLKDDYALDITVIRSKEMKVNNFI